jgi:hypothetical protein
MQIEDAIESFQLLGEEIRSFLNGEHYKPEEWEKIIQLTEQENPWFTKENIIKALQGILLWLDKDVLNKWLSKYPQLNFEDNKPLTIGVVMAGNIPLVGFHDFICVLLSGNIIHTKLSHSDKCLLPFLANKLIEIEPEWKDRIVFVEKLNTTLNAVIATGSNNTARHFEYYFKNLPHIIRKNRNGIAILDGTETGEELNLLGKDIFSYFGLGCRNVSKLYVPHNYNFDNFFRNIESYKDIINHNKYHSNYVYNRTIYLMDGKVFTDNGFLAVINSTALSSPIAVLNFEEYENIEKLAEQLNEMREQIQCIVDSGRIIPTLLRYLVSLPWVKLGETQSPSLLDYADGVDVMQFLLEQRQ